MLQIAIPSPSTQAGFTLIEALVALMITALVAAVAIQGLGTLLGLRISMSNEIDRLQSIVVQRSIVVDSLAGILPDYRDRPHVFIGGPKRLSGLTTRPLNDDAGAPKPFVLRFAPANDRRSTALIYTDEHGRDFELLQWQGVSGAFWYRDLAGDWSPNWPPVPDDTLPQTPWLVRVDTGLESNRTIVAFVQSPHERRFRLQDVGVGSPTP
ncbi:MAG: prepilin-type N-terminal cleavage/methylation domain-containing protein [Alphaproteobacteria bacterium]|nr:prepilin-type N-terminal cleavage/methylation domain-containing protein [Alphaproteobacteria bacterium]